MWTTGTHVDASPNVVWQILTDLDLWPKWGPTVSRARLTAGPLELGARGTVTTPVGISVPFEITDFEPEHRWAWKVAGIPATAHGVSLQQSGCRVWMSSPVWAPAYLPVLAVAVHRIAEMAEHVNAG